MKIFCDNCFSSPLKTGKQVMKRITIIGAGYAALSPPGLLHSASASFESWHLRKLALAQISVE